MLKRYRKESVLAPLFKLMEALMDLLVPLLIAGIINDGIGGGDRKLIIRYFLLLIALTVLGMLFSFTAQWFAAKASTGFSGDLRQKLFDHIGTFSYAELDRIKSETLILRLTNDVNQIQTGLNLALRLLLRSPFIVFGAMVMAFTIDFDSAMIFVVAIILLTIVVSFIMLKSIPLYGQVQSHLDRLLGKLRENLSGVRVIRAFRKEEDEIKDFEAENDLLTRMNRSVAALSSLLNPSTYLLINIATVILIYVGALRIGDGHIRQGDLVALYNYMAQIIVELIKLVSLIITINRSLACADRVADILDIDSSMTFEGSAKANNRGHAVRFDKVSFTYGGSKEEVLSDVSFAVKKDQSVGIIGATGSGKTTLIDLLHRGYDVQKGKITLFGNDIRDYGRKDLSEMFGIVPQKAVLFEGTIRDNLLLGNEGASDEEIWKALDIAQARNIVEEKEEGLDHHVEQGGRNLSGGQRQRLCIARALVRSPKILILDDSSSALDMATDYRLRSALKKLEGMILFIVSQRTSSVKDCDIILVMDDGRLVGKGTNEELLRSNKVYQEIYYSQYPKERKVRS